MMAILTVSRYDRFLITITTMKVMRVIGDLLLYMLSLQEWAFMALHNFKSFVDLSNVCHITIPPSPSPAIHLHRFIR